MGQYTMTIAGYWDDGRYNGGYVAIFNTDDHALTDQMTFEQTVREIVAEWCEKEFYDEDSRTWELPDYDWNYGDLVDAIASEEEIQQALKEKGINYEDTISFNGCHSDGEIAIPQSGTDRDVYDL